MLFFLFKQKTAYEMRISDWSSDVCSSDLMIEAMAARLNLLAVGMDAQVLAEDVEVVRSLKGKPIPEGSSLGAEYVKAIYTRAAMQQRPMPKPTPEAIGMWGGEIFVFPNLMILPQAGNALI